MKAKNFLVFSALILFASVSCKNQPEKKVLGFKDYPDLKIGFSTQNFQASMPNTVANLTEIIQYASKEGYQFIELRDPLAKLTEDECKSLAEVAKENKIDVIYEIHINPLDTAYFGVFEKGLANTVVFPGPGILRTVVSGSEFKADPSKKGWNSDEILKLARICDSCTNIAKSKNVRFIVENFDEAFFGDGASYYGISDLFSRSPQTGFQLDMSNMFRKPTREMTDPEKVLQYLPTMGNQWVTTHLKTVLVKGGDMQPVLTENPLPVEKIVELMGKQNVIYAAFELASVPDKQQCFANHAASVQFLKDKGLLK
jgi:sugar phosphate isomerase/epimerase